MKHRTLVLSLAAGMLLLGCASTAPSGPLAVQPVLAVRNGGVDADGMYRIGRSYLVQGRHEEAVRAFRAALEIDLRHAEARNALGAAYFAQGWIEQAEQQFRAAIAAAPGLAHLRKNLARLYSLTGRQPAERGTGAAVTPAPALQQVAPPGAAAVSQAAVPAAASQLVSVATNVWELKPAAALVRAAPPDAAPQAVAATVASGRPASAQRVEVSNGNGVPGLARRVAQFIDTQGYRQTRTSNLRPFNQHRSEVQYRAGAQRQARELGALLEIPARQVAVASWEHEAGVRLILGRDFKGTHVVAGGNTLAME